MFSLNEAIICEITKNKSAINRYKTSALLNASFISVSFTFLKTKYKDTPVTKNFKKSLQKLQSFFLYIQYVSKRGHFRRAYIFSVWVIFSSLVTYHLPIIKPHKHRIHRHPNSLCACFDRLRTIYPIDKIISM